MADQSRPARFSDVKLLIKALNELDAEYLLIGGYALYIHGYHRTTEDIDILIPSERKAGEIVKQALLKLPDKAAQDIDVSWIEEGGTIRVADEFIVDVMTNACGESYESLKKYMEIVEVDGISVRVVNIEGLIKTKKSVRPKDKADLIILEKALGQLMNDK
jgi:penicillin V acylase-like amidase (Ntn superfamily)